MLVCTITGWIEAVSVSFAVGASVGLCVGAWLEYKTRRR